MPTVLQETGSFQKPLSREHHSASSLLSLLFQAVVLLLQHFLTDKTQTQGKKNYKKTVNSSQMLFMFTTIKVS